MPGESGRRRKGAWSRAKRLAEQTPERRNRYVDFLRAASIMVVMAGHWLMAAPVVGRRELTLSDMLQVEPWTQWLTWAFQVMPLFFIVGGYANAVSWESARHAGRPYGVWIAVRLRRLVTPILPLVVVWAGVAVVGRSLGADPVLISVGSRAALIPTWFLAVYVMVCVAAPATHALWRRYGMASFWGLMLGAVLVDTIAFSMDVPLLRWVNYAFVWLGVHHVGYVWRAGKIRRPTQALGFAAGGLALLVALVTLAGYPVSMLTVTGEEMSNSRPPTLALLALGVMHGGLALALEAPARRWLKRLRPWTATVLVNGSIMTLYLWHVTAMGLVIGVSNLLGGVGLRFEPGSSDWWLTRPLWLLVCGAVLLPFTVAFGRFERSARAPGSAALPIWRVLVGSTSVCIGLAFLARIGISAPGPLGFRVWIVLLTLAGAALVIGRPVGRTSAA